MASHAASSARYTTNSSNSFIVVAPDTTATRGVEPPERGTPTVARRQFLMIHGSPYQHTSDDVIFAVYADRQSIPERERASARSRLFATGQACLRSSDLAKKYGWGIHSNSQGKVALVAMDSADYAIFAGGHDLRGTPLTVHAAMRTSRARAKR